MNEQKRVKHIQYSMRCFNQSTHRKKFMASIQHSFFGNNGERQLELSLQVGGSSELVMDAHSQEPRLIS